MKKLNFLKRKVFVFNFVLNVSANKIYFYTHLVLLLMNIKTFK